MFMCRAAAQGKDPCERCLIPTHPTHTHPLTLADDSLSVMLKLYCYVKWCSGGVVLVQRTIADEQTTFYEVWQAVNGLE